MRAVQSRPVTIRIRVETDLGVLADATGAVTVTVTDQDGTVVSTGAATHLDTGRYTYTVTAADLRPLSAHWSCTLAGGAISGDIPIRVVDRRAVPMSLMRQDAALAALADWDLLDAVDGAEDALEGALRFRIVTTRDRVTVRVIRFARVVRIPGPRQVQSLIAATRDGVAIDISTIAVRGDQLEQPTATSWNFLTGGAPTMTWLPGEYRLDLQHGMTETPADIQRAVRILARHIAATGGSQAYPDRAAKIMSAETEIWFSRIGPDNFFGLPEVDAVVVNRRMDLPIAGNPTWQEGREFDF